MSSGPFPFLIVTAGLSFALASASAAQKPPPQQQPPQQRQQQQPEPQQGPVREIVSVSGACQQLIVAGADRSAGCRGPATNINYRNGRTSFAFAVDDVMVSFSGPSEARGGALVTLTLDAITIASDQSEVLSAEQATGRCEYPDPFAGRAAIRCTARTEAGHSAPPSPRMACRRTFRRSEPACHRFDRRLDQQPAWPRHSVPRTPWDRDRSLPRCMRLDSAAPLRPFALRATMPRRASRPERPCGRSVRHGDLIGSATDHALARTIARHG